jgi:hypothetical protein
MKMVKRTLIAIAVVALLATSVQALDYGPDNGTIKRDDSWPTVYVALDLCTIPVFMDVGMYVQVKECDKRKIKLVQVDCTSAEGTGESGDFPCYYDCEEVEVRANFAAVFALKLNLDISASGSAKFKVGDEYVDTDTIIGNGEWEKLDVCVKAWKAEIWKSNPGDEVPVGSVTLTVKPL